MFLNTLRSLDAAPSGHGPLLGRASRTPADISRSSLVALRQLRRPLSRKARGSASTGSPIDVLLQTAEPSGAGSILRSERDRCILALFAARATRRRVVDAAGLCPRSVNALSRQKGKASAALLSRRRRRDNHQKKRSKRRNQNRGTRSRAA